jgi:hypothetical protein
VINLKKIKSNIVLIILGCLFTLTSLTVGYLNQFSGEQGFIYLLIGVPLLTIGIVFTPKIWKMLGYIMDMITMLFSR